ALIPASVGDYEIAPAGRCVLLKIYVPDIEVDIVEKLRARGITEKTIQRIVF
ncbi:MAG: hypothetical protein HY801_15820, partial [Candidatus Lindowbacteria bacterium]|nr:hypothetical protein [Candidatus Lindowbacteria bacterium]